MNYHDLDQGENSPTSFRVVVEIPRESRNKYELEHELLTLDRVLHSSLSYPTNYGFIPRTLAKDGDALDALVWSRFPLNPTCVVHVRPIGMLRMRDEEGEDNKILTVLVKDPFFEQLNDINDVQKGFLNEISQFFRRYKELEEAKTTTVEGWFDKKVAMDCIKEATERFSKSS